MNLNDHEHLRIEINQTFINAWNLNDHAHREEHFRDVERTAHVICDRLNLSFPPELILYAAFFHDLFAWSRFNHHQLSAEFVKTTDFHLIARLDRYDIDLVADGCFYHRASGTLPFPNKFAELICSADRGEPSSINLMMKRAMMTRFYKEPYLDQIKCMQLALEHLKEKYGSKGYARIPDMYRQAFAEELAKRTEWLDGAYVTPEGILRSSASDLVVDRAMLTGE